MRTDLRSYETISEEFEQPSLILERFFARRVEQRVEHRYIPLIQQRSLKQETREGGVHWRFGSAEKINAIGEEEGDDGGDCFSFLAVDAVLGVGEDEIDLVLFSERQSLQEGDQRRSNEERVVLT